MDVVQRLEPVVIEIERERECVCVVGHQAILRALYGYFTKTPLAVRPLHGGPLTQHAGGRGSVMLQLVVIATERERECVCVVGHQAILRALYGYFTKTPLAVSCPTDRLTLSTRRFKPHRVMPSTSPQQD